jgi:hypothetical protein
MTTGPAIDAIAVGDGVSDDFVYHEVRILAFGGGAA